VSYFPSASRKWKLKRQLRVLKPLNGLILGPLKSQALNLKAVRKRDFTTANMFHSEILKEEKK